MDNWIRKDRENGGNLYIYLARYGKRRWKGGKRKRVGASLIPLSAGTPVNVLQRSRREIDLETGKRDTVYGQKASLVTLFERTSRFTLCSRIKARSKEEVCGANNRLFNAISRRKETLTLDNGGEFADHAEIMRRHSVDVFLPDIRQVATGHGREHQCLLRRVWPKKLGLSKLSDEDIRLEIFRLNMTPRKISSGLTPLEVFTGRRVALIA